MPCPKLPSSAGCEICLAPRKRVKLADISATFRQHEILLTGANGFLGKVLLGMLLDRYPDLKGLHVVIRPRKNLTAEARFDKEILHSPALRTVVESRGADFVRRKVVVWSAELGELDAADDPTPIEAWTGRVGLIVHCAGLVEFFPPLDESLRANVDSTEQIVRLARRIGAKLLHVSTCYVAGQTEGLVEETRPILGAYPYRNGAADLSFDHIAELSYCRERIRSLREPDGAMDNDSGPSREVARQLSDLGRQRAQRWGWVNTYTYTKSLAEQIVAAQADVEHAIVRPAIVESALRFPFPGWVEGGRTAAPLVLMALGGMKVWPARKDIPLEVVPVDLVAAAIWTVGALLLRGQAEPLYQLGSADRNPLFLGPLIELLEEESRRGSSSGVGGLRWLEPLRGRQFVSEAQARRRRVNLERRVRRAERWIGWARNAAEKTGLPGGKTLARWSSVLRTVGLQTRFREQTMEQYLPFILHHRYIFESHNIRQAYAALSEEDRRRLPWDPESIDWHRYWRRNQIEGIKKWVQPEAVRQWAFKI